MAVLGGVVKNIITKAPPVGHVVHGMREDLGEEVGSKFITAKLGPVPSSCLC